MLYVALALCIFGFLGCFISKVPGSLMAFIGLLLLKFSTDAPIETWYFILCGALVVVSMYVSYSLVPKVAQKVHAYGKASTWGTVVGSLIALLSASGDNLVMPIIMLLVLPYVLAFLFEMMAKHGPSEAAQRAGGGYIVYLMSTVIDLAVCILCFRFVFSALSTPAIGA